MPCHNSTTRERYPVDFVICWKKPSGLCFSSVWPEVGSERQFLQKLQTVLQKLLLTCSTGERREGEKEISVIWLAMAVIQTEHHGNCPLRHTLGFSPLTIMMSIYMQKYSSCTKEVWIYLKKTFPDKIRRKALKNRLLSIDLVRTYSAAACAWIAPHWLKWCRAYSYFLSIAESGY